MGLLQKLDQLDAEARAPQAMILYKNMMGSSCRGDFIRMLDDITSFLFDNIPNLILITLQQKAAHHF